MAMGSAASPGGRLRDVLAGLFDEAFRLERHRRRRHLALVALIACIAVGCVLLFGRGAGGGVGHAGSGTAERMALTSQALPKLGGAPTLSVIHNRLVVSTTDNRSFAHGRVLGTCSAATVDPRTLHVLSVARGNCGDPTVFGEHVMPIVYAPTSRNHPGWGVNPLAMRIATVDRSEPAGYRLGPVIVTYPDGSDTRAETIQGDGSLWVYASTIDPRGRIGELLRVSLTTGRVVGRWPMPAIYRALLATDADGLWLAPSNESGWPEGVSAAQRVMFTSLYHVSVGGRAPERVFDVGPWGARWLVASGHRVWLDRGRANGTHALWRFDGARAVATLRGAHTEGDVRQCGDLGEGSVVVVGGDHGIFCVTNPNPGATRVQWLSPSGGRSRTVANVSTEGNYEFPDNAVLYRGAYYFVEPSGTLYRVAPR